MDGSRIERIIEAHKALVAANAAMQQATEERDAAMALLELNAVQLKGDILSLGIDVANKEVERVSEERRAAERANAIAQWKSLPECAECGGKLAIPSEAVLDASLVVKDLTSPCVSGPDGCARPKVVVKEPDAATDRIRELGEEVDRERKVGR